MATSDWRAILAEVIGTIPEGRWFLLREDNADDVGISKATGISRMEIKALFVNAGIIRETQKVSNFKKKEWEHFRDNDMPKKIKEGNKGKDIYIGWGNNLAMTPTKQTGRSTFDVATQSEELKVKIRRSTEHYNRQKEAQKKAAAEKKRQEDKASTKRSRSGGADNGDERTNANSKKSRTNDESGQHSTPTPTALVDQRMINANEKTNTGSSNTSGPSP